MHTVLLVDPRARRRSRIQFAFQASHRVLVAESVQRAMELCEGQAPRVVLLSVEQEENHGFWLGRRVHRSHAAPRVLIYGKGSSKLPLASVLARWEVDGWISDWSPESLLERVNQWFPQIELGGTLADVVDLEVHEPSITEAAQGDWSSAQPMAELSTEGATASLEMELELGQLEGRFEGQVTSDDMSISIIDS